MRIKLRGSEYWCSGCHKELVEVEDGWCDKCKRLDFKFNVTALILLLILQALLIKWYIGEIYFK